MEFFEAFPFLGLRFWMKAIAVLGKRARSVSNSLLASLR